MSKANQSVSVHYFTDILCVWAYIAQVRVDELCESFGDAVTVEPHFRPIFGDVQRKIDKGWSDRGGFEGYGKHVRKTVSEYEHVEVHPDIWTRNAPHSSLSAHVFLNAVRVTSPDDVTRLAWALRQAFFVELVDISRRDEQIRIAQELDIDTSPIETALDSGAAHAELNHDLDLANEYDVKVSPTLVFNEGRQRLVGNVGYRIIEANVSELLERPGDELSWC